MTPSSYFVSASIWLAEHRTLVRIALVALPIIALLALATTSGPAHACWSDGSGGGC